MKTFTSLPRAAVLTIALSLANLSFAQPPPGPPGGPPEPIPHRRHRLIVPIPLPPPGPPPIRIVHHRSHSDSTAAQVQRKLKNLGYYNGSVDGEIGAKSRAAIRTYQEENRLEITGQIDKALLASLGL